MEGEEDDNEESMKEATYVKKDSGGHKKSSKEGRKSKGQCQNLRNFLLTLLSLVG